MRSAVDYWTVHGLPPWADADDVQAISRAINCGSPTSKRAPNGLTERIVATSRARIILI